MGIGIIFRGMIFFTQQFTYFIRFSAEISNDMLQVLGIILILVLLTVIGFLIIFKSGVLAKKIVKADEEQGTNIALGKSEVLHLSIIVLCLYFLVTLFPSVFSAIYNVLFEFVDNYKKFREMLFQRIGIIIVYFFIILIITNSKRFSGWLEEKIMR